MAASHTVKQGEHLTGIALKYGFRDYHTLWDDASNAGLKSLRKNPNVIYPGDIVKIPDKLQRTEACVTTKVHRFQLNGQPLMLKFVVEDYHRRPVPNAECELEIDGAKKTVKTDSKGMISEPIPATFQLGSVKVADLLIDTPFKVGHLDPIDTDTGKLARLANLGYYRGPLDNVDDYELNSAIEEFQCDQAIQVDGDCGPATQAKLLAAHGC
jgi:N-acetylmuramoyl-L-alanine amidase